MTLIAHLGPAVGAGDPRDEPTRAMRVSPFMEDPPE